MKNQTQKIEKIVLVPEAADLMEWACETFSRPPQDIINGLLLDGLPQTREEYDRGEMGNQVIALHEQFSQAARGRFKIEDKEAANLANFATPESHRSTIIHLEKIRCEEDSVDILLAVQILIDHFKGKAANEAKAAA